jgi:hypothetical protein
MGTRLLKIRVENYVPKENPKWYEFALLKKRKEVKEDPNLVVNGRRRRSSFPPLFISPSNFFTQTFIFSFDFKHLLYHGSRPLLMHFLHFPSPINYDRAFRCHKSFLHSLLIWFWLKIIFPFLEIMASHMANFYGPQAA